MDNDTEGRARPCVTSDVSLSAAFGVAAGAIACVDAVPYIRDVLRGTTRPHRGTWCIWSLLAVMALLSQLASGAEWSLLMLGIQAASVMVVFILSITRGVGGLGRWDVALIALAAFGLVGWLMSSQPIVATACVVVADVAGVLLMLPKTWRDPRSETASSFSLAAASGALGAAAVGSLDPFLLIYPAYFAIINGATAGIILVRRRMTARPATRGRPQSQR